jgi:hypothetical protein
MSRLELVAESQSQESGFLALADIASLAKETGIEYRVVGGLMVTLYLAVSGADDPTSRQTLDADLGVTQQVAADPALVAGLEGLGYERPESANRFIRQGAQGRRMVIDVLMPSYISRMKTNQRAGGMTLDAIPGLNLALSAPGEPLEIAAQMLDGTVIEFVTVVPNLMAALCVKTVGYGDRRAQKDALDVWRLLEAYRLAFPSPPHWPQSGSAGDAAEILRRDFGQASGAGGRAASSSRADRTRIRALVLHAVGT